MRNHWMKQADETIAATYARQPIVIERGEGCRVWDTEGREYLDFIAGIAVCNLGHSHPRVADAICRQSRRLLHVSNLYYTVPQTELAQWLVFHSFADRVFFCNSGAEANEAAIKLARRYFYEKGETDRFRVVAATQSFHGRTMATLTATGQDKIKKGFSPLLEGFSHVPFDDIAALEQAVDDGVAAVLLEPIQGEGGVRVPSPGYLKAVRKLCDDRGALLIFDEIQTGIGRTGRLFAYEHFEVEPDIMTLAKALANGLPMGAMLATERIAEAFGVGAHASTFGGTPIVSAAALETLRVLTEEGVLDDAAAVGVHFRERLEFLATKHPAVTRGVRGMGLLLGLEVTGDGAEIVAACREKGFLINCVQGNILRFAPPLIVEREDVDALVACLDEMLAQRGKS